MMKRIRIQHLLRLAAALFLAACAVAAADTLPRRGYLGAQIGPVPDSLRIAAGLDSASGLLVMKVIPGGSAEQSGLKSGDILLKLDGQPVTTTPLFFRALNHHPGGSKVEFTLLRDGRSLSRQIKLQPYPKERPADFEVLYESVPVRGDLRRVLITKPRGEGRHPVVLMVGGIGCYSLDVLPGGAVDGYNTILYALTREGFVTVRVEKSGMGDSQGPPCQEVDFETELDGYRSALGALGTYDFLDTTRVILLGHSMGGIAAPLLSEVRPLAGIIAMATSANDWIEYELINQRRQLVLEGTDYDSIQVAARKREMASYLLFVEQQTPDQILAAHPDLAEYLQYPAHYTYMQQVANLNPGRMWKTVDVPVLVVYGKADFVTSADDHRYLVDLINHYHPGRARYAEVDSMDHFLNKVGSQEESYRNTMQGFPNKTFSDGVLPVLIEFCKSVPARS